MEWLTRRSPEENLLRDYRWSRVAIALVPWGLLMYGYLWIIRRTLRSELPHIPTNCPQDAIVFGFHSDYYVLMAVENLDLPWLGYHGVLSYMPLLWFFRNRTRIFRYYLGEEARPYEQILKHLNLNRSARLAIGTDSGRPYGRVRESLIKLAIDSGRPLVGLKMEIDRYVTILSHKMPLPFAKIQVRFTQTIPSQELKSFGVDRGRMLVQNLADHL